MTNEPGKTDICPQHIAIIMDGNGRWAQQRGKERVHGHFEGVNAVIKTVAAAVKRGVRYLTLYSFSTENWSRPQEEVQALMGLFCSAMAQNLPMLQEQGVRLRFIGDDARLPEDVRKAMHEVSSVTENNTKLDLILALNYGGRDELLRAAKRFSEKISTGALDAENTSEDDFAACLDTADIPDPELLIRTSGEMRLSNFLLWQLAYSEFYITPIFWPDFAEDELDKALLFLSQRQRRFGGIK